MPVRLQQGPSFVRIPVGDVNNFVHTGENGPSEDLLRIGNKLVSCDKASRKVRQVLSQRAQGLSQHEVALRCGVDRSFVSRVEKIGEVRKGHRVALIGFPLSNIPELARVAEEEGVEFHLLMSGEERRELVDRSNGAELINRVMAVISEVRKYDAVVVVASDYWVKLAETLLGGKVIGLVIGESPMKEDACLTPERLRAILEGIVDPGNNREN